jgi:hypothetical protein
MAAGLVLAFVALAPNSAPVAAPVPAALEPEAPGVSADYTVYIGGFKAAEGTINATLRDEYYELRSFLGVAGMPRNFFDAKWTMESEGHIGKTHPQPARFAFHSNEQGEIKHREMTYDTDGRPETTFNPPLPPHDEIHVLPHERQNTLDPISALLVPVAVGSNPCNRRLAVFDGKRRYDLQLTFDSKGAVTTRDNGYSGKAIRCTVQMIPHSGMRQTSFTRMLQQRDNAHIWLARMNGGNIYIPIRIQMRTPIGSAVMDVVKLRQYAAKGPDAKSVTAK